MYLTCTQLLRPLTYYDRLLQADGYNQTSKSLKMIGAYRATEVRVATVQSASLTESPWTAPRVLLWADTMYDQRATKRACDGLIRRAWYAGVMPRPILFINDWRGVSVPRTLHVSSSWLASNSHCDCSNVCDAVPVCVPQRRVIFSR